MKFSKLFSVAVSLLFIIFDLDVSFCSVFKNEYVLQNGLAFPHQIEVLKGQTIMARLLKTLINQEKCLLQNPNLEIVDLANSSESFRVEKWDSECSVKIKNIEKADAGRWQLYSTRGNKTLRGIFTVHVDEKSVDLSDEDISLVETENTAKFIEFTDKPTSYCYLSQNKSSLSMFVHGNCNMSVEKLTKNLQGTWKLTAGVSGLLDEVELEKSVFLYSEEIDVGYIKDSSKNVIHMYCNLMYSEKNVTFCRFERMHDEKGFHLVEGLGNDHYSYYGNGLWMKECGMTIENPNKNDYGNWRCNLGVTSHKINSTLRRVVILEEDRTRTSRHINKITNKPVKTILSVIDKPLTIDKCQANTTISYCWMKHPNGTEFMANVKFEEDLPYWYSNEGLDVGECSMTLKHGTPGDTGLWTCHMGQARPSGMEITDQVMVRVTGSIAAVEPVLTVQEGEEATLECVTAGGLHDLEYCRFLVPDGTGFSISELNTREKAIDGQYYFKKDAALYRGECAVTIAKVTKAHLGNWTCFGMIQDDETEYRDFIMLKRKDSGLSTASVTGIVVGMVLVAASFSVLAYITWKRRHPEGVPIRAFWTRSDNRSQRTETLSVNIEGRPSNESGSSETQLTASPEGRSAHSTRAGPSGRR